MGGGAPQSSRFFHRDTVVAAVNWALRSVGKRNAALNEAAVEVAKRLGESANPAARWVGKDALRELASPAVQKRFSGRKPKSR